MEEADNDNSVRTIVNHNMQPAELMEPKDHHLSLNALKVGAGVGTIRFMAYIEKLLVTVLIDGGSSDSLLQPRVAKFLKLPVEPVAQSRVMVGNGNYMSVEGLIKQLKIQVQ
ncbi:Aspartyl protease, partial [Sesbania bispinosa]